MCCILCVCIYVITLYCIYGMFLIDYGTPVLFKSFFLKLFIKALLSRLLDTSAIEIHYYYYYYNVPRTEIEINEGVVSADIHRLIVILELRVLEKVTKRIFRQSWSMVVNQYSGIYIIRRHYMKINS